MKSSAREILASLPPSLRERNREALATLEPCPSAARHDGGARAKVAGDTLEAWLDAQHREGVRTGLLAWARHVGPPFVRTGPGGKTFRVIGTGPADYVGQLSYGKALVVEAKSRVGRLELAKIPEHQVEHLEATVRGCGLALLVYEHRDGARVERFAVPWDEVPWCSPRGGQGSIGPEDCVKWRTSGGCYLARFA